MNEAKDFEDLVRKINYFKLKSNLSFLQTNDEVEFMGLKLGHKSNSNQKYDWMHKHFDINYEGKNLDVRIITPVGRGIHFLRPRLEEKYNDEFLERQTPSQSVENELNTHFELEGDVNVLEVNQELNKKLNGCFVSKKEENTTHFLDHIIEFNENNSTEELIGAVREMFSMLNLMHYKGIPWGDANMINILVQGKALTPTNFVFKPNEYKTKDKLFAKDFMGLYYSAVHRTNLPIEEVAKAATKGYFPSSKTYSQIQNEIGKKINPSGVKPFFKPVFGLDEKEISTAKKTLYEHL